MTSITAYQAIHRAALLELSLLAWEPVFPLLRDSIPWYVYDAVSADRTPVLSVPARHAPIRYRPAGAECAERGSFMKGGCGVGMLIYGPTMTVEFDDRVLAHLQGRTYFGGTAEPHTANAQSVTV